MVFIKPLTKDERKLAAEKEASSATAKSAYSTFQPPKLSAMHRTRSKSPNESEDATLHRKEPRGSTPGGPHPHRTGGTMDASSRNSRALVASAPPKTATSLYCSVGGGGGGRGSGGSGTKDATPKPKARTSSSGGGVVASPTPAKKTSPPPRASYTTGSSARLNKQQQQTTAKQQPAAAASSNPSALPNDKEIPMEPSDVFQLLNIKHGQHNFHSGGAVVPYPLDPLYVIAGDHDKLLLRDSITGASAGTLFVRPPTTARTSPHGVVTASLCTAIAPMTAAAAGKLLLWTGWSDGCVLLLKQEPENGTFFCVYENSPPESSKSRSSSPQKMVALGHPREDTTEGSSTDSDGEDSCCGISFSTKVSSLLPLDENHIAAVYGGCGACILYHLLFDGPTVAIRHEFVRVQQRKKKRRGQAAAAEEEEEGGGGGGGGGAEEDPSGAFVLCGAVIPSLSYSDAPALALGMSNGTLVVVTPAPSIAASTSTPAAQQEDREELDDEETGRGSPGPAGAVAANIAACTVQHFDLLKDQREGSGGSTTNAPLQRKKLCCGISSCVFSIKEKLLWIGFADGSLDLWRVNTIQGLGLAFVRTWKVHRLAIVSLQSISSGSEVWSIDEGGVLTKWFPAADPHNVNGHTARQTMLMPATEGSAMNVAQRKAAKVVDVAESTRLNGKVVWVTTRGGLKAWFLALDGEEEEAAKQRTACTTEGNAGEDTNPSSFSRSDGEKENWIRLLREDLREKTAANTRLEADLQSVTLEVERQYQTMEGLKDELLREREQRLQSEAELKAKEKLLSLASSKAAAAPPPANHADAEGGNDAQQQQGPQNTPRQNRNSTRTTTVLSPSPLPPYPGNRNSASPSEALVDEEEHPQATNKKAAVLEELLREKSGQVESLQSQIRDMLSRHEEQLGLTQKAMKLLENKVKKQQEELAESEKKASSSSKPATRSSSQRSTAGGGPGTKEAKTLEVQTQRYKKEAAELRVQLAHKEVETEKLQVQLQAAAQECDELRKKSLAAEKLQQFHAFKEDESAEVLQQQLKEAKEKHEKEKQEMDFFIKELVQELEHLNSEREKAVDEVELLYQSKLERLKDAKEATEQEKSAQLEKLQAQNEELQQKLETATKKEQEANAVVASVLQTQRERISGTSPRAPARRFGLTGTTPTQPHPGGENGGENGGGEQPLQAQPTQDLWWKMHYERVKIEFHELQHRVGLQKLWSVLLSQNAERRVKQQWIEDVAERDVYIGTMRTVVNAYKQKLMASVASESPPRGGGSGSDGDRLMRYHQNKSERDELLQIINLLQEQSDKWYCEATIHKNRSASNSPGSNSPSTASHPHHHPSASFEMSPHHPSQFRYDNYHTHSSSYHPPHRQNSDSSNHGGGRSSSTATDMMKAVQRDIEIANRRMDGRSSSSGGGGGYNAAEATQANQQQQQQQQSSPSILKGRDRSVSPPHSAAKGVTFHDQNLEPSHLQMRSEDLSRRIGQFITKTDPKQQEQQQYREYPVPPAHTERPNPHDYHHFHHGTTTSSVSPGERPWSGGEGSSGRGAAASTTLDSTTLRGGSTGRRGGGGAGGRATFELVYDDDEHLSSSMPHHRLSDGDLWDQEHEEE